MTHPVDLITPLNAALKIRERQDASAMREAIDGYRKESQMTEKHTLCLRCRKAFSDQEIKGHQACPACGGTGVPADLRQKHTLTLTDHEWRLLFIWADNWAEKCEDGHKIIAGIIAEAKRQQPTLPALSLFAEIQDVANALGTTAEIRRDGESVTVYPEKKHYPPPPPTGTDHADLKLGDHPQ